MDRFFIALFGHSATGRSPLADELVSICNTQLNGFRSIVHLDFGELLRTIAAENPADTPFFPEEHKMICQILDGRLFSAEQGDLVEKILLWFYKKNNNPPLCVFNGIPRHEHQARTVARLGIRCVATIELAASPRIAKQRRILSQRGEGVEDRRLREDSSEAIFQRRVESYRLQTVPVIEHYRARAIPHFRVSLHERTPIATIINELERNSFFTLVAQIVKDIQDEKNS